MQQGLQRHEPKRQLAYELFGAFLRAESVYLSALSYKSFEIRNDRSVKTKLDHRHRFEQRPSRLLGSCGTTQAGQLSGTGVYPQQ